jgi:hypothetical protein
MDFKYSKTSKKSKSLSIKQQWGNLTALYTAYDNTEGFASIGISASSSFDAIVQVFFNDFLEKTAAQETTTDQLKYQFSITADTPFYKVLPIKGARVRLKFSPDNNVPAITDTLLSSSILGSNTNFTVV